jgi:radical SAM protein with 4Fe4S-binding SPASM domain
VFEIAQYATEKGLRVVLGTNGTLITQDVAFKLKRVGISRVGVSLDFPSPDLQDDFRGKAGAFKAALAGIKEAREAGIQVQINTTITKLNVPYLEDLLHLALEIGAVALHPFLLVPTGRGKGLAASQLAPEECEEVLNWIYDKQAKLGNKLFFKPTDAPHYFRIVQQRNKGVASKMSPMDKPRIDSLTRGCLAGVGFCFISHRGRIQGCGYLDLEAGSLREKSFGQIWTGSPLFGNLRDLSCLKGKCGVCEYKTICGGCRARAYETNGDYMSSDPCCVYEPTPAFQMDDFGEHI